MFLTHNRLDTYYLHNFEIKPTCYTLCSTTFEISTHCWKLRNANPQIHVLSSPFLHSDFQFWGAWVAQLVEHWILDLGSGHDPEVPCARLHAEHETCFGFSISLSVCLSVSLSLPPPPLPLSSACAFSLKKKKKKWRGDAWVAQSV